MMFDGTFKLDRDGVRWNWSDVYRVVMGRNYATETDRGVASVIDTFIMSAQKDCGSHTASILTWVQREINDRLFIYAFGRTEDGKSSCFVIDDYYVRLYFRVPKVNKVAWNTPEYRKLISAAINRPIGNTGRTLLTGEYQDCRNGNKKRGPTVMDRHGIKNPLRAKDTYVEVLYNSNTAARNAVDAAKLKSAAIKLNGQSYQLEPMEEWIDSVKKLIVDAKLTYTGWTRCDGARITDTAHKHTNAEVEVHCSWKTLSKSNLVAIAHYTSLHYDLETQGIGGMFPNKFDPRCHITSASYYYTNPSTGQEERIVVVYGDAKPKYDSNAPITVFNVDNEADLIRKHFEFVHAFNPDIISGYNILSFDEEYIYRRSVKLGVEIPTSVGRVVGVKSEYRDKSWKSTGAGRWVDVRYIDYVGRVVIDVYKNVVNLPKKLPQNKLNTVALEYLGRGKHDVSPQEMFDAFDEHMRTRSMFKACLASYGPDGEPICHSNVDGEVWDAVCNDYIHGLKRMQRVLDYCMEDTMLSMGLYLKLQVITTLSEAANTFEVPIFDVYTKGQSGKGTSMLYTLLREEGVIFDTYEYVTFEEAYEGALNLGTKYGNRGYFKFIASVDVAGMYPSQIRDKNISHDTEITEEEAETLYKGRCRHDVWYDYKGTAKERAYETWIVDSDVRRGFLPRLLDRLYSDRVEAKKLAKKHADSQLYFLYDARQNSIKLAMNSVYGLIGMSANTRLPAKHLASLVTFMSRQELMKIVTFLENGGPPAEWIKEREMSGKAYKYDKFAGAKIIYGDTDSVQFAYPQITFTDIAAMTKYYNDVTIALNTYLSPIIVELEKMGDLLLNGPKNYAMRFRDQTYYLGGGNINPNAGKWKNGVDSKGMDTVRQNKAKWHKNCLKEMLLIIMDGDSRYMNRFGDDSETIEAAKLRDLCDTVFTTLYRAFMNIYPDESYQIYENYTREGVESKVGELARRQSARGKPIEVGDRIGLVFVNFIGEGKETLVKHKTRLLTDLDDGDRIDTIYYIKQAETPFDNIMTTRYNDSPEFSTFWQPVAQKLVRLLGVDVVIGPNETPKEAFMRHFVQKCSTSKNADQLTPFLNLSFDELMRLRNSNSYETTYSSKVRSRVTSTINKLLKAGWTIALDTPNLVGKFLLAVSNNDPTIVNEFFKIVLSREAYANLANL